MIVASLDAVSLLKQEDAGRFYHAPELEIGVPDYRLVLKDGRQILVEVKNETEVRQHGHTKAYFQKMLAYAGVMKCDLYVAIDWVRWRQWTLVHARHFKLVGDRYELDLTDALLHNEMALVGDQHFATTSLRVRVEFEPLGIETMNRRRSIQKLIVKQVGVYCDDRRLEDPAELRIAMAFVFYGTWGESESTETNAAGGVTAHNFDFTPQTPDEGPSPYEMNGGFAMIASLSGIITGQYNSSTTRGGKLTGVLPKFVPGSMKDFLPDRFFERQDRSLRLWAFTMVPGKDEAEPTQPNGGSVNSGHARGNASPALSRGV
jgi:hypothetical protein